MPNWVGMRADVVGVGDSSQAPRDTGADASATAETDRRACRGFRRCPVVLTAWTSERDQSQPKSKLRPKQTRQMTQRREGLHPIRT